jgi:hypothetical protein
LALKSRLPARDRFRADPSLSEDGKVPGGGGGGNPVLEVSVVGAEVDTVHSIRF